MTVNIEHTEIFDQSWNMWAEGTSVDENDIKPKEKDIEKLLKLERFTSYEIDIWHDSLQKFWRWSCKIRKQDITIGRESLPYLNHIEKGILNIFERYGMVRVIGCGCTGETVAFSFRDNTDEGQGVKITRHLEKNLYAYSFFNFHLLDCDKYIPIAEFKNEDLIDDLMFFLKKINEDKSK